ncbi:MAG: diaminopropionate ammonia-lyase [Candidatus Euphemobacter frigidus]|nr:diaminopropionate ammonia-lyase [Candidatus Euphemobacter frigidus]MDP8275673.1 diaminopropionate ammonia-lyase [Candidatus Euphemobacter frigidus]
MKAEKPVEWLKNTRGPASCSREKVGEIIPPGISRRTRELHRQLLGYRMSPLKGLDRLSALLGLGNIWVKDESQRLTLNSFKVLGGTFAIYNYLKQRLGIEGEDLPFSELTSPGTARKLGDLTFAAATDGNHGRGVAWAAGRLGRPAVIYVHQETSPSRIRAIEASGARVVVVDGTYDDAVRRIREDALKNDWQIIEDTSWEGYEEIPIWVMQGYTTMFGEIQEQLSAQGFIKPTHIFVQAGVGSLAAATIGYYRGLFGPEAPVSIVTEPDRAAGIFESARIGDGRPHPFGGNLDTIMAGLACGEPNPIAWEILRDCADYFITCPDYVAAKGMRVYGVPMEGDPFIVSGESGAVTLGALMFIMQHPQCGKLKKELNLGPRSQVLLINTEGNTDPFHFRRVVWEGSDPVPFEYRSI